MRWLIPQFVFLLLLGCVVLASDDSSLVGMGDYWRYFKTDPGSPAPPGKWRQKEFDDTRWHLARSGYVLPEDEPGVARPTSVRPFRAYLRRKFSVADPKSIRALVLQVEHEKGFTAYLNGIEIARHRGNGVRFPIPAERARGREDPEITPAIIDVSEFISLLEERENVLAIEADSSGESLSSFTAAAALVINFPRGPYLQNVTTNSIEIIWRTPLGLPGTSFVEYGITDALGSLYTNSASVIEHVAPLMDLRPDTLYYYRVGTVITRNGIRAVSSIETFRTSKITGPIRFVVFGDSGQGSVAQSQIADVIRNARPELVLHCGDIVYGGFSDSTADTRFFSYYAQHLKNTPYYLTAGNHDVGCCEGETPDWNLTNWMLSATAYQSTFHLPTNTATGTEHFYSFDHGDAHFICLYNPWFYNYYFPAGADQLNWLTNDLANSSKPWKFIFFHMPLANSGMHALVTSGNGIADNEELMAVLLPIAQQYNVQVVFGGHDHNFERFAPTNGLHHCVNGGGGGGVYQMNVRHMASSQFWANNNCTLVTVNGDTLTLEVLNTGGEVFDSMVIHRGPTPDRIYQSRWNSPEIEITPANDGDGNIMGQQFDFIGPPIVTGAGQFSNLGCLYVNNDSTNLYIGIKSAMFYGNNNIFLFIETPRQAGVSNLVGLGNGLVDPTGEGVDGLDILENLSFTNFTPSIACVLGDEFADGQFRSFSRSNLVLNIGQGVFHLDSAFSDVTGTRLQQFNRSPQNDPVPNDANADFIEIAIPFSELVGVMPGDVIQIGAVVGNGSVDLATQRRGLDTAVLGTYLNTDSNGQTWLTGVKVRVASLPDLDSDGDGLLDDWEVEFGLNPNSAIGDDGADGDPDHDGATNAQEQLTGTDPRDANSVFRLTLTPLSASRYFVTWRTVPGRRYQLEYSDNQITNFAPFAGPNWPRLALSSGESYLDNTSTNQPSTAQRNYRVRLVP